MGFSIVALLDLLLKDLGILFSNYLPSLSHFFNETFEAYRKV